ncbi:MAG: recombinase family protein [Gammaproteobacteria bacterium]|nr:recombinase family protein [Gammaproteobacteria bacterium]
MQMAAIYTRVSSERQREAQTIASQTAALVDWVTTLDLEVPREWIFEDDGYSGATLERLGLEGVRDLAAAGDIKVVLVHSPDRLSRKYAYQVLLIEELGRHGVETRFLNAPSSATAEDQEHYTVTGWSIEEICRWLNEQGVARPLIPRGLVRKQWSGISHASARPSSGCSPPTQEELVSLDQLRERMPLLRQREQTLRHRRQRVPDRTATPTTPPTIQVTFCVQGVARHSRGNLTRSLTPLWPPRTVDKPTC